VVVNDLCGERSVLYVTVMPLAALIRLFEVGAKPEFLNLVAVVMLVVAGVAALVFTLGRYYRRIGTRIGR
jgi:predicted signal transduction protein with EAL and GGDEF domain